MQDGKLDDVLLVVSIVLIIISSLFVGARLWARFVVLRKAGWDDYTIIPAYIISLIAVALTLIKCYRYNYNGNLWDIEYGHFELGARVVFFELILYSLARAFVNISFLLLYLRVLSRSNEKIFRWTIIGSIVFVICYTLAIIFGWIFQCAPVEAFWRQLRLPEGYNKPFECYSTTHLLQFMVIITVLTHVWIAILPLYVIQRVKVNTRQKEVLWMFVGLGFLVVGASVAWLYHQLRILDGRDSITEGYTSFIWNCVALKVAIICACGPALNIFFVNRFAPNGIMVKIRKRKAVKKAAMRQNTRPFPPDEIKTFNMTVFEHEAYCTWVSNKSFSRLQVPERAVLKKVTINVHSESKEIPSPAEKSMALSTTYSIGDSGLPAPAPSRSSMSSFGSIFSMSPNSEPSSSWSPKSSGLFEKKETV